MNICKICNGEIKDYGYLLQKYGNAPQRCEKCRRESRIYRAKIAVIRELLDQRVVKLGEGLIENAQLEKEKEKKSGAIYSIGGREFGPWGGAEFSDKFLIHVLGRTGSLEPNTSYDFRLMKKTDTETGKSWTYIVLEPTQEDTNLILDFRFTRIYKTTLKGYGRQFDDSYPVEVEHETILTGWSTARSGRYGNEWELFLLEGRKGEWQDQEAENLLV